MSFREDVFAKIITYITVAVLLGAMLVEAFVIYAGRRDKSKLEEQLAQSQESISNLTQMNLQLADEKKALQESRDSWEELAILTDNELYQTLREDLYARPEMIPLEAIEASLQPEADEEDAQEIEEEEREAAIAGFGFADPAGKKWLLPLNLGNKPSAEYLFYARAENAELGKLIDILYQIPVDPTSQEMILDEEGQIIWKCMAYDVGHGWQICQEDHEE